MLKLQYSVRAITSGILIISGAICLFITIILVHILTNETKKLLKDQSAQDPRISGGYYSGYLW